MTFIHLFQKIINMSYDGLNKKIEYMDMEHILFQYKCTNNTNNSRTFLLYTANIVYIDSQIAGIKITDYLSAYIFQGFPANMDYCLETTVVIVAGNVVVTSGFIRNGSIT